eukprot:2156751-Amphidinium_carterae.1
MGQTDCASPGQPQVRAGRGSAIVVHRYQRCEQRSFWEVPSNTAGLRDGNVMGFSVSLARALRSCWSRVRLRCHNVAAHRCC